MKKITRLFDFVYHQLEKFPKEDALVTKYNGQWVATSTQTYIDRANAVSRSLLEIGVNRGDKIAVISTNNRTEWHIVDIAIQQIGAIIVPIYPTISNKEYEYIINHSESRYVLVSDVAILEKVNSVLSAMPSVIGIASFDKIPGVRHLDELIDIGHKASARQAEVEAIKDNIKTEDLVTIIYTSGTTGQPKGVMLSHQNIVANVLGCEGRIPFNAGKSRAMSFLPICHIYERMVVYLYQYYGVSVYFAESIEKLSENLNEVHPNVITVVPRLVEKVYDKIYSKGADLTGIKRMLFFWAIGLAEKYKVEGNSPLYNIKLAIARKLIFSKWKAALGGELELMVSGSAPLQPRLIQIFAAADLPVMEGYGLTETSPVVAVNDRRNNGFILGTVGRVLPNVKVKIAEDGEILVKAPSVMMGYYKNEELTNEVMSEDGYFHTGDIGELSADNFLKITDRKKEIFKTSGGKYVAPQVIENTMKSSRFIEQIMVIGEGEKMPAAFIQPNFEFVRDWAKIHQISLGDSNEELCANQKVIDRIMEDIEKFNKEFGKWEQVKSIQLIPSVWSIDAGELTPTLKLKRKVILQKYQPYYDKIYRS